MASDLPPIDNRFMRNADLSAAEKQSKKLQKQLLKQQIKRRKYQIRLDQARRRGDIALVERTQKDLDNLLETTVSFQSKADNDFEVLASDQICTNNTVIGRNNDDDGDDDYDWTLKEDEYHRLIASIYERLQKTRPYSKSESNCEDQVRQLLQHMTKGTQVLDMFDNAEILWGYARQKFVPRAVLIASSLQKLKRTSLRQPKADDTVNVPLCKQMLECLQSVTNACSLGCGPGCEVVGLVSFFQSLNNHNLHRLILVDWAMPQWMTILNPLKDILQNDGLVNQIYTITCNILLPLKSEENEQVRQLLTNKCNAGCASRSSVHLYLISYLLTETRGKWQAFFRQLVEDSCKGTLFLFTDPTAWQLQLFCTTFSNLFDFVWLDSSMFRPELQSLNNRVGSAVLMAMKQ